MSESIPVLAPTEQTEGSKLQVLRWLKDVGADVVENEPLIEIETDKVTVEVPAPATGVLREILRRENEEIEPGELLAQIEIAGAAAGAGAAGTVVAREASGSNAGAATATASSATIADAATASRGAGLSPAVRRLLRESGVDAADVAGSGAQGRITVDDVLRAAAARSAGNGGATRTATDTTTPTTDAAMVIRAARAVRSRDDASGHASRRVPHTGTRKRIAERIAALNTLCKDGLAKIPGVKVLTPRAPELSAGIICFDVQGQTAAETVRKLLDRNVIASSSPYKISHARLAPSLVNDEREVETAVRAVREIA